MLLLAAKQAQPTDPVEVLLWGGVVAFILLIVWLAARSGSKQQAKENAVRLEANRAEAVTYFARASEGLDPVETNLILQDGEHALLTDQSTLYETRSYRRYAGAGTSIRGIHVGGGASDSQQTLRRIDGGMLTLTNKRIVFDGSTENRNIKLGDVLSVEGLADGIEVSTQRRQKSLLFSVPNPIIWATMVKTVASGKFSMREKA